MKKKVLLVDDEPDFLEIMGKRIESWGYEIIPASNGKEALDAVMCKGPHLVILDYMMPQKDGMQVAKEILEMNPKQRIIFASAYVEETLEDAVKQLKQVVELMQKPFAVDALVDTIEDKEIYEGLKEIMLSMKQIKNESPSPQQLKSLFESVRKIQKGRTF